MKRVQSPPAAQSHGHSMIKHSGNAPGHSSMKTSSNPSVYLLFSLLTRGQFFMLLFPAILASVVAGGIAPFMTHVVGQSFDAFSRFPLASNPPRAAKVALLHSVGIAAIELAALAVGALAMGGIMSGLWISVGENNVLAIRKHVYDTVTKKDLTWFDANMAEDDDSGEDGTIGAGGLMAKFSRETDDVRMASSLATGATIQHLTTVITCLLLAFIRSYSLTLVIMASIPLLVLLQGIAQSFASPLLTAERSQTATAATLIARAVSSISTVKAFNAAEYEYASISRTLTLIERLAIRIISVFAISSSLAQFVTMAMFAQGFWFGSKLIREGKDSPGDVMAVFWACLIAASNLQLCVPQLIVLAKGKSSMASLLTIAPPPLSPSLRKIVPTSCIGELSIQDVTFAYPSRPDAPVLQELNIFLPARETTFIVGGSGSGKSTIASLLQNLYTPQAGSIHLDDQDISFLDNAWLRRNVTCVSQQTILFDMSLYDNVALGKEGATRQQVIEACTRALMHDFVRTLPDRYETILGVDGASLSGGQRQRLGIARALLRDPPVLILDECTSALDVTSRLLVFEAIRRWRKNKTTVVITHDLSLIGPEDFVYALKNGRVIEQGYRADLEKVNGGEWRSLAGSQSRFKRQSRKSKRVTKVTVDLRNPNGNGDTASQVGVFKHPRLKRPTVRPITIGGFSYDLLSGGLKSPTEPNSPGFGSFDAVDEDPHSRTLRRVNSTPFSIIQGKVTSSGSQLALEMEEFMLQRTGAQATKRRRFEESIQDRRMGSLERQSSSFELVANPHQSSEYHQRRSLWRLVWDVYPSIPRIPLIILGIMFCILSGAMTPVFAFLLSRLLFEVSIGSSDVSSINTFGAIVLGAAAVDGLLIGLKYFIMESAGSAWLTRLRSQVLRRILAQDKKWFDSSVNSPVAIVQILVKDGDDARVVISEILGQTVVVCTMFGVGLVWALLKGWQLTLVGVGIAPMFGAAIVIQSRLVTKCEVRNKRAREDVAKEYYEAVSNIRGIRAMAIEKSFHDKFNQLADAALSTGIRGAVIEGCTYGLASALIYLAEAVLFYVGAVLMANGTYSYLQMIEVLNLIVFSVTIGSQIMAFTEKIARSVQATRAIANLLKLSTDTDELLGTRRPPLDGPIMFDNVSFSYPERPGVSVLKNFSATIEDGECIAVVGCSGSGKSTVAALLQRLYEPSSGLISIGGEAISRIDVTYLRDHIAVVSQRPYLFHATISENITYGKRGISARDIRQASKAANVHEFAVSLPQGYDTVIGEDAALISGGQAQRLQIARALARPCKVLILDECTSALDPINEVAVLDAVRRTKYGQKTIMITHKLSVMQMCDRILVLHHGRVAEDGTYSELMSRNGTFSRLARAGEWTSE